MNLKVEFFNILNIGETNKPLNIIIVNYLFTLYLNVLV